MDYSVKHLSYDELKEFLLCFPYNILSMPIVKNEKHFSKQKLAKGFRANKIPMLRLAQIYYDEIQSVIDTPLESFLISSSKHNLENTQIEQIIDDCDDKNILETSCKVEGEIIKAGLTISPKHVFWLANKPISENEAKIMDSYHNLIIKKLKEEKEECSEKLSIEYKEKYTELENQYFIVNSEITTERNRVRDLNGIIKQKDAMINAKDNETQALNQRISKLATDLKVAKEKVAEFDEIKGKAIMLKSNSEKLERIIDELNNQIAVLQEKTLDPEMIKDICVEVLEDLRTSENEDFTMKAKEFFMKDEMLNESWRRMSNDATNKIENIIHKMKLDDIKQDDIEILDVIENYIYFSFMIIKGLKVVFYRYLEQETNRSELKSVFCGKNSN